MSISYKKPHPEAPIPLMWGAITLSGRHGYTVGMRFILMVAFGILFLNLPDLDQKALWLLHHRSILTHSVLPALVLGFVGAWLGAAPVAGGLIGISVHLACDALSPAVGFGQVWLPAPWKIPLGDWSQPWLLANALLSYLMALSIAVFILPKNWGMIAVIAISGALGGYYGIYNEGALSSVLVAVALPLVNVGVIVAMRRRHRAALRAKAGRG